MICYSLPEVNAIVRIDGWEALGSAAGLAPAQPASTRMAASALAAVKGFTEGRRAAGGVGSQPPTARAARHIDLSALHHSVDS